MKIGEILVGAGLITDKQLELALAEQSKTGAKLGVILADLGFTTEDAVSRALAEQSGVEHLDIDFLWILPEPIGNTVRKKRVPRQNDDPLMHHVNLTGNAILRHSNIKGKLEKFTIPRGLYLNAPSGRR